MEKQKDTGLRSTSYPKATNTELTRTLWNGKEKDVDMFDADKAQINQHLSKLGDDQEDFGNDYNGYMRETQNPDEAQQLEDRTEDYENKCVPYPTRIRNNILQNFNDPNEMSKNFHNGRIMIVDFENFEDEKLLITMKRDIEFGFKNEGILGFGKDEKEQNYFKEDEDKGSRKKFQFGTRDVQIKSTRMITSKGMKQEDLKYLYFVTTYLAEFDNETDETLPELQYNRTGMFITRYKMDAINNREDYDDKSVLKNVLYVHLHDNIDYRTQAMFSTSQYFKQYGRENDQWIYFWMSSMVGKVALVCYDLNSEDEKKEEIVYHSQFQAWEKSTGDNDKNLLSSTDGEGPTFKIKKFHYAQFSSEVRYDEQLPSQKTSNQNDETREEWLDRQFFVFQFSVIDESGEEDKKEEQKEIIINTITTIDNPFKYVYYTVQTESKKESQTPVFLHQSAKGAQERQTQEYFWKQVRRVPQGQGWHPAKDRLSGSESYNHVGNAKIAWSLKFDHIDFDQFLFTTGMENHFLKATKEACIGETYYNQKRDVLEVSGGKLNEVKEWENKDDQRMPYINMGDNKLLYAGNSLNSSCELTNAEGGAKVYIRVKARYESTLTLVWDKDCMVTFKQDKTTADLDVIGDSQPDIQKYFKGSNNQQAYSLQGGPLNTEGLHEKDIINALDRNIEIQKNIDPLNKQKLKGDMKYNDYCYGTEFYSVGIDSKSNQGCSGILLTFEQIDSSPNEDRKIVNENLQFDFCINVDYDLAGPDEYVLMFQKRTNPARPVKPISNPIQNSPITQSLAHSENGGWKKVRWVPQGDRWHPAVDQLRGTEVYGKPHDDGQAWSVDFETSQPGYNQFLFTLGDFSHWAIMNKDEVIGEYSNQPKELLRSSVNQDGPIYKKQYRRQRCKEDPWISLEDHPQKMIYGEYSFNNMPHSELLQKHGGAAVYIRTVDQRNLTKIDFKDGKPIEPMQTSRQYLYQVNPNLNNLFLEKTEDDENGTVVQFNNGQKLYSTLDGGDVGIPIDHDSMVGSIKQQFVDLKNREFDNKYAKQDDSENDDDDGYFDEEKISLTFPQYISYSMKRNNFALLAYNDESKVHSLINYYTESEQMINKGLMLQMFKNQLIEDQKEGEYKICIASNQRMIPDKSQINFSIYQVCNRLNQGLYFISEFKVWYMENYDPISTEITSQPESELISKKIVLVKNDLAKNETDWQFIPLFANGQSQDVVGTQIVTKTQNNIVNVVEMPNFLKYEYQIQSAIALTGYKVYYEPTKLCSPLPREQKYLLIETRINDFLRKKGYKSNLKVSYDQANELLDCQLKCMLNTVPMWSSIDKIYEYDSIDFDFATNCKRRDIFKPLEVLKGGCYAASIVTRINDLQKLIELTVGGKVDPRDISQMSLVEYFCQDRAENFKILEQLGFYRRPHQMIADFHGDSLLDMCLEKDQPTSFKILIDHLLKQNSSEESYQMIFKNIPEIVYERQDFIKNIQFIFETKDEDENKINFYQTLQGSLLPKYSEVDKDLNLQNLDFRREHESGAFFTDDNNDVNENYKNTGDFKTKLNDIMVRQRIGYQLNIKSESSSTNKPIAVKHSFIDFRILQNQTLIGRRDRVDKLRDYQKFLDTPTDFNVAKFLLQINKLTKSNIEDQAIIRDIIDFQFKKTKLYYQVLFTTYVIFFCLPISYLFFNLETISEDMASVCLHISFLVQFVLLCLELVNMKDDGFAYFLDIFNLGDLVSQISFYCYFYWIKSTGIKNEWKANYGPETTSNYISNEQANIQILKFIILASMIMKVNFFMKVDPRFGQLGMLVSTCIVDIIPFTIYMMIWLLGISLMYKILGFSSTGYDGLNDNTLVNFFLQVWENSIGNIGNPAFVKSVGDSQLIIFLIYFIWFCNQFLVLIILLNFLIAVISQSYEKVKNSAMMLEYQDRCQLNREAYQVFQALGWSTKFEVMVITQPANKKEEGESLDEWQGFVQTLKKFIKKTTQKKQSKVKEVFNILEKIKEDLKKD